MKLERSLKQIQRKYLLDLSRQTVQGGVKENVTEVKKTPKAGRNLNQKA